MHWCVYLPCSWPCAGQSSWQLMVVKEPWREVYMYVGVSAGELPYCVLAHVWSMHIATRACLYLTEKTSKDSVSEVLACLCRRKCRICTECMKKLMYSVEVVWRYSTVVTVFSGFFFFFVQTQAKDLQFGLSLSHMILSPTCVCVCVLPGWKKSALNPSGSVMLRA